MDIDFKVIFGHLRISHGKLFQIFTPYLEKDLVCLSNLECLT